MKVEIRSKVVILLCIVLAVFSSCITDDDDDRGDFALVAGDALPQFSVEMSDGGVLNTQSFSGKVGVISILQGLILKILYIFCEPVFFSP